MGQQSEWKPEPGGQLSPDFEKKLMQIKQAARIGLSEDVMLRSFQLLGRKAALIYVDGLADDQKVQLFMLRPCLTAAPCPENLPLQKHLTENILPLGSLQITDSLTDLLTRIFSGDCALLCEGIPGALIADVKGFVRRSVGQPVNETVVVGPHEGFNESLRDNIVLMRRLMRTPALISESLSVGNRIPARVCLLYLSGIARQETVDEVRRRIQGCNIDYVASIGMLEQLIEDDPFSLLPQAASTERPDRAVGFLNDGQVVIAMENASTVLAVPMGFFHLYHAPDDSAMRWQYGTFLRLLRMAGLLIALLLPAFFLSLVLFHPEGLPLSLLTSVVESQGKVPLSLFSSMLVMLLVFSLINEAGSRVPGSMGGSLSIVSGLILGQAAVEADLFSPLIIIVVAISGLGSYAVPSFALTIALRIAQFLLVLCSGLSGFLGMMLGLFFLLLRGGSLNSFGNPYFSPVAPRRPANPDVILRLPIWRQRLRGNLANAFHMDRTKGPMRAWEKRGKK